MSCDCSGCQRAKQISTLRQLQPDEVHKRGSSKYPTKSNKVLMDRYLAARKTLLLYIEWYKRSYERRKKNPPKPNARYVEYFHEPIKRNSWGVKKYKEARAIVKQRGLI